MTAILKKIQIHEVDSALTVGDGIGGFTMAIIANTKPSWVMSMSLDDDGQSGRRVHIVNTMMLSSLEAVRVIVDDSTGSPQRGDMRTDQKRTRIVEIIAATTPSLITLDADDGSIGIRA